MKCEHMNELYKHMKSTNFINIMNHYSLKIKEFLIISKFYTRTHVHYTRAHAHTLYIFIYINILYPILYKIM